MKTYTTLYKVWAAVEGEAPRLHEAISYQFEPYLVPSWEEGPDGVWSRPERLVPLKPFGARAVRDDLRGADFEVDKPVPLAAWAGPATGDAAKYGVIFRPPARRWKLEG